ncbi:MAG: hypothetical protein WEG56_12705 [Chloroflexota bacterium]
MSVPVQIPVCDLGLVLRAPICPGCGSSKTEGEALCGSCVLALPLYLRDWITRPGAARGDLFAGTLERALGHLVGIRDLRNRRWPYRSLEELAAAGYGVSGQGQCESLRCLSQVLWLWTPQGRRMPVDPITYEPHAIVCLDPVGVVLRRIRRLQTPARRRRAGKGRTQ